jgi:hypothetical protein
VGSYKAGELILVAGGKKIVGRLASNAAVKVNSDDLSYAQPGDTVKLKAWPVQNPGYQQQPGAPRPAMAEEISITAAKPLSVPKKGRPGKSAG